MKALRAKIGADRVRTVHGVGYALEPGRRHVSSPLLDQVTSVKVKLGLLVAVSVTVASVVAAIGAGGGVPFWLSVPVTVALALGVTQLLAVGMTSPLREMTAAARRMARGDYSGRVTATSSDEVGELARAFNRMAEDLAAVDRQRRELVANVSHELRTPLAALCAVLENLVDGVAEPDPVALRAALDQAERLAALASDLLDLARVDAGEAPLSTTQVPVLELLERAVAEARVAGREVSVRRPGRRRRRSRSRPTRRGSTSWSPTCSTTRPGTAPPVGSSGSPRSDTATGWRLEVADEGPGHPRRRPGPGLRAVRDPGGGRRRRRHRPRPGHRPLGDRPPRRHHPLRRPGAGQHRRPGARRPPARATAAHPRRQQHRGAVMTDPVQSPAQPRPAAQPTVAGCRSRPWTRCSAGSGPTPACPATCARSLLQPRRRPAGRHRPAVPGPRARHLRSAAGRRGRGPRLQRPPPITVHPGLCRAVRAAGRDRRRPGRRLDRGPVPAGRRRGLRGRARRTAAPCPPSCWRRSPGRSPGCAGCRGWVARVRAVTGVGSSAAALRTVVWSLLAVVVFGLLFASADAVFAEWAGAVVPDLQLDSFVLRAFVTVAVGGVVLAATYLALNPPRVEPGAGPARPVAHRYEWLAPVLLVDGVFLVFLGGAGHRHLRRARLPRAHHRAHLRGVRPPGLRPAHGRHRADPAGGLGGRPQGTAHDGRGPGLAARVARPALRC